VTYSKLVKALLQPETYPHRPEQVELIQTHISFVFIAGDYVYKVKKPVQFDFLDFTTLEKRRFYCQEELRLNRRLAPETYLGVDTIFENEDGGISLESGAHIVEYAVRRKRLPQDRMLKKLISVGQVDPSIMDAIARRIADFHRHAETGGRIDEMGGIEAIRKNQEENFQETEAYINRTIGDDRYRFIRSWARQFLEEKEPLFRRRVRDHRIRDCHGDLHLDHICLFDGITIFDCIEFNERFRYEDVAAEVSFLAMDMDYNGMDEYGDAFVKAYIRHARDTDIGDLLYFYKGYYAFVRGKVMSFEVDEEEVGEGEREKAAETAARYFELAFRYAARLEKPALVIVTGLMGSGKSVLARILAPWLGAETVRTDVLRKEMLNLPPAEHRYETFGEGIYADKITAQTYDKAHVLAKEKLESGQSVIIDASYGKNENRLAARKLAADLGVNFFILECRCPEAVIRKRLEGRMTERGEPSDGRWEIFTDQKKRYDAISGFAGREHIVVDTSMAPERSAMEALSGIKIH